MKRLLIFFIVIIVVVFSAPVNIGAQGILKGSLESNTIVYVDDSQIHSEAPVHPVGSNNYLKLDYSYGKFTAGIQMEYYPQPLPV